MTDRMIENRIKKLVALNEQLKAIKAQMAEVENELEADLAEKGEEVYETEHGMKVRWQEIKSNKFDTTKFKKFHADIYAEYLNTSVSRRFTYSA